MKKPIVLLLLMVLVSGLVFTEPSGTYYLNSLSTTSVFACDTVPGTQASDTDIATARRIPINPDVLFFDLRSTGIQETFWIQPARFPKLTQGFIHTGHGVKYLAGQDWGSTAQSGRSKLATAESLLTGITSLSPTNLILRI